MSGFMINRAIQSGNLTRDPELRATRSGTAVCSVSIAVNERYKDGQTGEWMDRPNYFDWTIWGGIGEWVAKNLGKGDPVTLEGRAQWRMYVTRDGSRRYVVDFVADSVVPGQRGNGGGGGGGARSGFQGGDQSGFEPRDTGGGFGFAGPRQETGGTAPQSAPAPAVPEDDDIPF